MRRCRPVLLPVPIPAAVRTLKAIEPEQRPTTAEERQVVARFAGFGPVAQSSFPNPERCTGAVPPRFGCASVSSTEVSAGTCGVTVLAASSRGTSPSAHKPGLAVPGGGRPEDVGNQPRQLGDCLFADGTMRPVFADPDGRQYVEDDGERVYGTWLPPAEEPVTAPRGGGRLTLA
jgi:hypothetical protein